MTKLKLNKKIIISGEIEALTGLLIGGSNNAMGIGGPDKMVIRNPFNNQPYIPGSSLKGKIRSLMELSYGYIMDVSMGKVKNGPSDNIDHITALLFGTANSKNTEKQRPSRILFSDGKLLNGDDFRDQTDLPYTESKTEVVIDRITAAAMPRTFERVPAGATFELRIVLNIFEQDKFKENELLEHTFNGLLMLQDDYLGGSGSRGSGRVKFKVTNVLERDSNYYHTGGNDEGNNITQTCNIPNDLL